MEFLDTYNINREKTDKKIARGTKLPNGLFRLVVHLCIINSKGEMLIQKRQSDKKMFPDMWDISVGGCAVSGETSAQAIGRELFEELGIKIDFTSIRPSLTVNFDEGFNDIYLIEKDINLCELKLQEEEVQEVKWATKTEILTMIDEEFFVPYRKSLISTFFEIKGTCGTFKSNFKIHKMKLNPEPFGLIASEKKTFELRLNDEKRRKIETGDTIVFTNTRDSSRKLSAKVVGIHRFKSFSELYKNLPLTKCGYTEKDILSAKPEDMEVYYSKEMQNKYGVIGIELKLI